MEGNVVRGETAVKHNDLGFGTEDAKGHKQFSPVFRKESPNEKVSKMLSPKMILPVVAAAVAILSTSSAVQAQGWFNPEIYNSGRHITGARFDPFTGRIIVRTDLSKVRQSYLDPNRNQIDPGSYRNVNRYETDMNGVRWHVTGTQWTSNGVPHGNLSRRRLGGNSGGPVVEDRNEHVAYSVQSGGQNRNNNSGTNRGTNNSNRYRAAKPAIRNYSPF